MSYRITRVTVATVFLRVFVYTLLSVYLFTCLPADLHGQTNGPIPPRAFRLSNELRVILAPEIGIDSTCVLVYHATGVRDDPANARGASFLLQGLSILGTNNSNIYDRILFIKQNGGDSVRIVNYDYSIFSQVIPSSELDSALWLESERVSSLRLSDENINIEKNNVYQKNYRMIHSNPYVMGMDWLRTELYKNTVYEIPVYGKLEEVRNFDTRVVRNAYKNFQNLSNIILVVAGNFDLPELQKAIAKHFAGLEATYPVRNGWAARKKRTSPPMTGTTPPKPHKYAYKNEMVENLSRPFTLYGIRGPGWNDLDYLYFEFIGYYLADQRVSKLDDILNRSSNLDITINHELTANLDANGLVIKLTARKRENLERAKYFVNKKLDALSKGKQGALSGSDLRAVKELMEIDFVKQMSDLHARSVYLAQTYYLTGKLDAEEEHLRRIRRITVYDIHRIAQKYLRRDNRVNVNVLSK